MPSTNPRIFFKTPRPNANAYSLDELFGALAAQHEDWNAFFDMVSTQIALGGTQRPGFLMEKLEARSITLTGSAGMMGKSSVRGKCVKPNWI